MLSAKMAKTDGIVAADEVKTFKEAFKVSAAEMKQATRLFNSAKRDAANFEDDPERARSRCGGFRAQMEGREETEAFFA